MRRIAAVLLLIALTSFSAGAQVPSQPTLPPAGNTQPVAPQPDQSAGDQAPPAGDQAPPPSAVTNRTCPVQPSGAFSAARLICEGLQDGQACLGNGIVESTARTGEAALNQPADRQPITDFTSLRLRTLDTENGLLTVVAARPRLTTTTGQVVNVLMIAFGDVTLTDDADVVQTVSGQRTASVIADFGLNIRRGPDGGADVLWQLRPGETVTVTGRLADSTWVRVTIPNGFGTAGWVYAPYLEVTGGIETVGIVDVNSAVPTAVPQQTVEFTNMQAFTLASTDTDVTCADAPNSGVLLQSPDGVASRIRTRINDVVIEFNGTLFVRSQPNGRFSAIVLEGESRFFADGFRSDAVAGFEVVVTVDGQSQAVSSPIPDTFDNALIRNLPVTLLARPVALLVDAAPVSEPETVAEPEVTAEAEPSAEATVEVLDTAATPVAPLSLPTPVVPAQTAPTPDPVSGSLTSGATGELCGQPAATLTEPASPVGIITEVGGIWRATAGTVATFEVSGATFQQSFNNYIRLNAVTGIVAQSGNQPSLTVTFEADTAFSATFSSQSGETLTITVRCGS